MSKEKRKYDWKEIAQLVHEIQDRMAKKLNWSDEWERFMEKTSPHFYPFGKRIVKAEGPNKEDRKDFACGGIAKVYGELSAEETFKEIPVEPDRCQKWLLQRVVWRIMDEFDRPGPRPLPQFPDDGHDEDGISAGDQAENDLAFLALDDSGYVVFPEHQPFFLPGKDPARLAGEDELEKRLQELINCMPPEISAAGQLHLEGDPLKIIAESQDISVSGARDRVQDFHRQRFWFRRLHKRVAHRPALLDEIEKKDGRPYRDLFERFLGRGGRCVGCIHHACPELGLEMGVSCQLLNHYAGGPYKWNSGRKYNAIVIRNWHDDGTQDYTLWVFLIGNLFSMSSSLQAVRLLQSGSLGRSVVNEKTVCSQNFYFRVIGHKKPDMVRLIFANETIELTPSDWVL